MKKIYYSLADYGSQEIIKVNEVLKKNSLTLMNGKNVKIFEKKVAGLFGKNMVLWLIRVHQPIFWH